MTIQCQLSLCLPSQFAMIIKRQLSLHLLPQGHNKRSPSSSTILHPMIACHQCHPCLSGTPIPFDEPSPSVSQKVTYWIAAIKPHIYFIFFIKTMTISLAAKRGPSVQLLGCNLLMTPSSCAMTDQLYKLLLQFLQHLSHMSGCALIRLIILFGHLREIASHL